MVARAAVHRREKEPPWRPWQIEHAARIKRNIEVIQLMRRGWKNREIAEHFKLSQRTICRIKSHELKFAEYERTMRNDWGRSSFDQW